MRATFTESLHERAVDRPIVGGMIDSRADITQTDIFLHVAGAYFV